MSRPEPGPAGSWQAPADEGGPVFAEPWQAQAFALAVELSGKAFSSREWSEALGAELRLAAENGAPDDGLRYYEHWLTALERLVLQHGLVDAGALQARKAAWGEAYRTTPHGRPVELSRP